MNSQTKCSRCSQPIEQDDLLFESKRLGSPPAATDVPVCLRCVPGERPIPALRDAVHTEVLGVLTGIDDWFSSTRISVRIGDGAVHIGFHYADPNLYG